MREPLAIVVCVALLGFVSATQLVKPAGEVEASLPVVPFDQAMLVDTRGPVAYFVENCARCHKQPRQAYDDVENPLRGGALDKMLISMSNGPGGAPLDDQGLAEQRGLHMAFLDRLPYLWIDPARADVIAGETIPGTQVFLRTATRRIHAVPPSDEDEYRFILPRQPGVLEAVRNDKTTQIPVK
jgi:hypothetical protein